LAYTTRRIALPDGATLEGWHLPRADARGLVAVFHGFAASKESMLPQAAAFHRLGYAVFLVDFRGAGGSSGDSSTLGLRESEDVAATVAYIRQQWPDQPLVLYGASMGAAAILRAEAVAGLQPSALIIESPFDSLLTTTAHRTAAAGPGAGPAAALLLFWGGVQHGLNGFALNPADDAAAVRAPTLVLHGAHDPWVRVEEVERLVARLGGPKHLALFPQRGHMVLTRATQAEWTATVDGFLARALAGDYRPVME
jgi:alpha-beta hydrolase superfamily lysophospholipase